MNNRDVYQQYMYSYPHKTAYRPFAQPVSLGELRHQVEASPLTLYVHTPFCSAKCGYCNLFSYVEREDSRVEDYLLAVEEQLSQMTRQVTPRVDTVVFGGGTPLYHTPAQLERMFSLLEQYLGLDYTGLHSVIETAPAETTPQKLAVLQSRQIKRVSIGVQSFLDEELKTLRRHHRVGQVETALQHIAACAFPQLNLDLIYGIPGQTPQSLLHSLHRAVEYQPQEIFLYPLYIRYPDKITGAQPPMLPLYELGRAFLLEQGYRQHSMRRFTRLPVQQGCCGFENTISVGAGGRTYLGNLHSCTPYSDQPAVVAQQVAQFIEAKDKNLLDYGFQLGEEEQKRRWVIKNLFVNQPAPLADYSGRFSAQLLEDFPQLIGYCEQGYFHLDKATIAITPQGLALSDRLAPSFISDSVRRAMEGGQCSGI